MFKKTFSIALIGGICSGKTEFLKAFSDFGAQVLSADDCVKNLWQDASIEKELRRVFELPSHLPFSLSYIRGQMLQDAKKRLALENILHPKVFAAISRSIERCKENYMVVEMPLFVEINCPIHFDRVLLIDVPESVQIRRLEERSLPYVQAKEFISIQATHEQRFKVAQEVIRNTVAKALVPKIVQKLHTHYQQLSGNFQVIC